MNAAGRAIQIVRAAGSNRCGDPHLTWGFCARFLVDGHALCMTVYNHITCWVISQLCPIVRIKFFVI